MKFKTGLIGLIGFFLFILLIKHASGPELREKRSNEDVPNSPKRVIAKVGSDVTLDCQFEDQRDVTDKSVVWKFNGSIVLVYKSRGVSDVDQATQFKGRASKDTKWNPTKGNLAVKLSPVSITDAGEYNCYVGKENENPCSTILNIIPDNVSDDSAKRAGSNAVATYCTVSMVVTVLVTARLLSTFPYF